MRMFWLAAAVLLLAACARQPDAPRVEAAVQQRLDQTFGERVLELASLRRAGSAALPDAEDGAPRRLVYFHGRFRLARDYDFTAWNNLNLAALANLLGATDKGVLGVGSGGNRAGDELRVFGSVEFARRGDAWLPVLAARAAPPAQIETAGPGQPTADIAALAQMRALLDESSGRQGEQRRMIVEEETERALGAIRLRLDRLERVGVLAGGPSGGAYEDVARIVAAALAGSGRRFTALATEGSVDNLRRLREGGAELALVQADLAALAYGGQGLFAGEPPMQELRALSSLFPEALHVVVRADSGIERVADLAGKRLDIGLPGSGTRVHAVALLAAAGLAPADLGEARGEGLAGAVAALEAGRLDGFIATVHAPAGQIQRLAAEGRIRLLALEEPVIAKLRAGEPFLVPLRLPLGTYPGVSEPVTTVAVAALLATRRDLPAGEADALLRAIFEQIDFAGQGSAAGSQIALSSARDGLSIPLHEAAEAFLGRTAAR